MATRSMIIMETQLALTLHSGKVYSYVCTTLTNQVASYNVDSLLGIGIRDVLRTISVVV